MANTLSARPPVVRRIRWRQVIAWLPLALFALRILAAVLEPGQAFFDGQTAGIYLLFEYEGYIALALTLGIIVAAVLALVLFDGALILRRGIQPLDVVLAAASALIMGVVFYLNFMVMIDHWPLAAHRDTRYASGHIYHLAEVRCYSTVRCGASNFLKSRYAVIDCGALGIICQEVYLSNPIGWDGGAPTTPARPFPVAVFSHDSSNHLQLVEGETSLWTGP